MSNFAIFSSHYWVTKIMRKFWRLWQRSRRLIIMFTESREGQRLLPHTQLFVVIIVDFLVMSRLTVSSQNGILGSHWEFSLVAVNKLRTPASVVWVKFFFLHFQYLLWSVVNYLFFGIVDSMNFCFDLCLLQLNFVMVSQWYVGSDGGENGVSK